MTSQGFLDVSRWCRVSQGLANSHREIVTSSLWIWKGALVPPTSSTKPECLGIWSVIIIVFLPFWNRTGIYWKFHMTEASWCTNYNVEGNNLRNAIGNASKEYGRTRGCFSFSWMVMQQSTNSPLPPTAGLCGGFAFWVSQKHKSSQPGAHFMSKSPDNPQVKPKPNRVG